MSVAKGKKVYLDSHTATYLSRIIEALNPVTTHDEGYGTYHIGKVELHFDGYAIGLTIEPEPGSGELTVAIADPYLFDIKEEEV